jgi:hypothetical protein
MDPESKRLLEDTFVLAKDNHRLLRTIRRHQLISAYGKLVLWIILILLTLLSYQTFLKPYVDSLIINGAPGQSGTFNLSSTTPLGKLINSLKAGN